jgi:threonine dehydrogenase-like Zn-dependent dehydrogenase
LGDRVAVIGQGVVGNLCAQLFGLAGADVIGIDRSPRRIALAQAMGIAHTVLATDDDQVRRDVRSLTGGLGVQTAVEAVGNPALVLAAAGYTRRLGQIILLGSPRGALTADLTDLLNRVHLWEHGCLTLKGAHEWRFPVRDRSAEDPTAKHSLEDNTRLAFGLLAAGRLRATELRTHLAGPEAAQEVYTGVCDRQEDYLGVVFDWGGA